MASAAGNPVPTGLSCAAACQSCRSSAYRAGTAFCAVAAAMRGPIVFVIAATGDRREVVAVDQVVRYAGVIRVLLVDRLQNRDGLEQGRHALVVEGLVEGQRVEDLGLDVVGILLAQRLHRVRVVLGASVLV